MTHFSVNRRDPAAERFEQQLQRTLRRHLGQHLVGEPTMLYEPHADHLRIDVMVWAPTKTRPVWTLVTAGMSAHPMLVPEERADYSRIELVTTLPYDWPDIPAMSQMTQARANQYYWAYEELIELARLPYLRNTWLGHDHTVLAGRCTHYTYPGSDFSGMLLAPPHSLPESATVFEVSGHTVHCVGLYPLYPIELRTVLDQTGGGHAMYHRFLDAGIPEGIMPGRRVLV